MGVALGERTINTLYIHRSFISNPRFDKHAESASPCASDEVTSVGCKASYISTRELSSLTTDFGL